MADSVDGGGGPGGAVSPYHAYGFEDLRRMVAADDPGRVREHASQWRRIGLAMETFVSMVAAEIDTLGEVYASARGAPALVGVIREQLAQMDGATGKLMRNAHVLDAAATALEQAQQQMTGLDPGDGAAWRDPNPAKDRLTGEARVIVERLAADYQTATNALEFGPSTDVRPTDPEQPDAAPPSSHAATNPSAPVPMPQAATAPGRQHRGTPRQPNVPARRATTQRPASSISSGPPGSSGSNNTPAPAAGASQRPQVPGGRPGVLGGSRIPTSRGGTLAGTGGDVGAGGAKPGQPGAASPGGVGRPGATPGGGGPDGGKNPTTGAPGGGGPGGGGDRGRRGRRLTWYERIGDEFTDPRPANPPGGTIAADHTPPPALDPGPAVIGTQKHHTGNSQTPHTSPLPPEPTPTPDGFPDTVEPGSFTHKDGTRFQIRRGTSGA